MPPSLPQLLVTWEGESVRLGFADSPDWFGRGVFTGTSIDVLHTVDERDGHFVFRLEATTPLTAIATGEFARPSTAWPAFDPAARLAGGVPKGSRGFGFQYTEFCWPAQCDESLAMW